MEWGKNLFTNLAVLAFCIMLLSMGDAGRANGDIIANSVNEFSGVQGSDNWYYGYYDGDGAAPYTAADFEVFPNYGGAGGVPGLPAWYADMWYLEKWSYWTALWNQGGHPNALVTSSGRQSAEHWMVRRWISEVSGPINISGRLADGDAQAGDGVIGYISVDGVNVFQHTVHNGAAHVDYSVDATVSVGSIVDFAIAPRSSDWADTTKFTAVIVPEPTTLSLVVFSVLALCKRSRKLT